MATKKTGSSPKRQPRHQPTETLPGLDLYDEARDEAKRAADELRGTLSKSLRSADPLDFLAQVSGLIAHLDPRTADPFDQSEEEVPALGEVVDGFVGFANPETTAILAAIQALVPDDLMSARISRELAHRRHRLPAWLSALGRARIEPDVWRVSHVLGDSDAYLFGVTLPTGHALTALAYVDHNLGSVLGDALVVPEPLAVLAEEVRSQLDAQDQSLAQVDGATTRAVLEEAIGLGAHTLPQPESDSWPGCRPLVEWMLRLLPSGGKVPARPKWSEKKTAQLADAFFASRFGAGLDDPDRRAVLQNVLWFATEYGPGDPLRWSEPSARILLLDWFPRKVVADPDLYALLPDLLRGFIRYAHDRCGVRPGLTAEAVAAVDQAEPSFQQLVQASSLQGTAALIAGMPSGAGP